VHSVSDIYFCQKVSQVGNLLWKAKLFGIVKVETPETLLAEPKNLHLSPSNAKKRSPVIYGGEDVTRYII
jgi:hypothetical protein